MSIVTGLHHLGHVVRDPAAAVERYRRLGFRLPPPTFPAVPSPDGGAPRTFGAGNTHVHLGTSFVEVATVLDGPLPDDATIHPIEASAESLPQLAAAIADTSARLRAALDRFEGLHILAFGTDDADAAARWLSAAGVSHGDVHRMRRPVRPAPGPSIEPHTPATADPIGYLELDRPEPTPEGRLAIAEPLPPGLPADHPNGATALVEVTLRVGADRLEQDADRYRGYLGRPARREDSGLVFDLDGCRLIMIGTTEAPGTILPAFTGYAVAVTDLDATVRWLEDHEVPHTRSTDEAVVPAEWALGAEVTFRRS